MPASALADSPRLTTFIRALRSSRLVALYLLFLFVCIVATSIRYFHGGIGWSLGEWLINYEGGFVRRGLVGELALKLAHLLSLPVTVTVVPLVILLYAVLFSAVFCLTRRITFSWWTLTLFLSPVTLGFFVVSAASFHKEVILFAGLAVLLVLLGEGRLSDHGTSLYLAGFGIFGVLCHEPFVCYAPFLVAAVLLRQTRDPLQLLRILILPALATGITLIIVVRHPGDAATAQTICRSLRQISDTSCRGAITYLGYTSTQARLETRIEARQYGYLHFFPALTLLALIPFAGWFAQNRRNLSAWIVVGAMLLSGGLSTVLFLFGTDWGRWIEINLFCAFLLILSAERFVKRTRPPHRWDIRYLAVLLYSAVWSLPPYANHPFFGYLSLAGRLTGRYLHH